MDPITVIVTALIAGATAALKPTAEQAVKDAYAGFKRLIIDRYGHKGDVNQAVAQLESKPDSVGRKATLQEELATTEADKDQEVVDRAVALLKEAENQSPGITGGLVGQINAAGGKIIVVGGNVQNLTM
ncbi:MAG: hypothetical protein ACXWDN_01050 [Limisphaerales bacterium]